MFKVKFFKTDKGINVLEKEVNKFISDKMIENISYSVYIEHNITHYSCCVAYSEKDSEYYG